MLSPAFLALSALAPPPDGSELVTDLVPSRKVPSELFEVAPLQFGLGSSVRIGRTQFAIGETSTTRVELDNDGDGNHDRTVKGNGKRVALEATDDAGGKSEFAVGFLVESGRWTWRSMTVRTGELLGRDVWLLDRDANGRFDDDAEDVIWIEGEAPTLLADLLHIDGEWFHLRFEDDGARIKMSPYVGDLGEVDVHTAWEGGGELEHAVFLKDGGHASFNAAGFDGLAMVPVGDYQLSWGQASKGSKTLTIEAGRMEDIRVRDLRPVVLEWGGPAYGTVSVDHTVGEVSIGSDIRLYGRAGEEYDGFRPYIKTAPGFEIHDRTKKRKKLKKGALCPT